MTSKHILAITVAFGLCSGCVVKETVVKESSAPTNQNNSNSLQTRQSEVTETKVESQNGDKKTTVSNGENTVVTATSGEDRATVSSGRKNNVVEAEDANGKKYRIEGSGNGTGRVSDNSGNVVESDKSDDGSTKSHVTDGRGNVVKTQVSGGKRRTNMSDGKGNRVVTDGKKTVLSDGKGNSIVVNP